MQKETLLNSFFVTTPKKREARFALGILLKLERASVCYRIQLLSTKKTKEAYCNSSRQTTFAQYYSTE